MSVEENIRSHGTDAIKHLKKIIASKGAIQGNFYFAGDSKGSCCGIVITISTRDPKGSKVLARGKALRKEIPGAKFARGVVRSDGKLWLEIVAGSAKETLLRKSFKNAFEDKALSQLKKFLRKARFGDPTIAEDTALEEDSVEEINVESLEAEMNEDERTEFEALKAQESQLIAVNASLQEGFLNIQDAEQEDAQYQQELLSKIEELSRDNPGDPQLQKLRYSLAETLYEGSDPFPEVGASLAPEMIEVLQASIQSSLEALKNQLERVAKEIIDQKTEAKTKTDDELPEFSSTALEELVRHPGLLHKLRSQIHNMTQ